MTTRSGRLVVVCLGLMLVSLACTSTSPQTDQAGEAALSESKIESKTESKTLGEAQSDETTSQIYYLEIVTKSVDETLEALEQAHGLVFSEPIAEFGNARAAELKGGGRIGVRAPLRETEGPVVRPYLLVDDIQAAVQAAEEAGAQVALPPMEIPGQGTFAIYLLGGIQHGLWQN